MVSKQAVSKSSCFAKTVQPLGTPAGGYILVVCTRDPALELLHVYHPPNQAAVKLITLCKIPTHSLQRCLADAIEGSEKVLGHEPAESIHFLPCAQKDESQSLDNTVRICTVTCYVSSTTTRVINIGSVINIGRD